jgi:hypothetical protein
VKDIKYTFGSNDMQITMELRDIVDLVTLQAELDDLLILDPLAVSARSTLALRSFNQNINDAFIAAMPEDVRERWESERARSEKERDG